jgi:predicted  nucleic acid-binding Zn-ribbon protein
MYLRKEGREVHADLEALLRLQEKDKVVMGVEAEIAALEPEVEQLDEDLAHANESLEAVQIRAADAEKRRAEQEAKIETYRVMQDRKRQRLEWVRGAKEASTLMAELDLARTVLAREEAEWVKSADKVQEAQAELKEFEQTVEELKAVQAPKREELAARLAELDDRLKAAKADREGVAEGVAQDLQGRYDRIRRGRAPLALYAVRGGACGHCFTAVPLYRRQKLLNGQAIENCEACGVLLYDGGE